MYILVTMNKKITKVIPIPTIRRMPAYLAVLDECMAQNRRTISTTDFAEQLVLNPVQVRKDLAYTGVVGKPKIGYDTSELHYALQQFLGWQNLTDAILVGVGALGTALLGYNGFKKFGLNIKAAFDCNEDKCGTTVHGKRIYHISKVQSFLKKNSVAMAILTIPETAAQITAEKLVGAGITGFWTFSSAQLHLPANIFIQYEDLATGLAVLSVRLKEQQKESR